MGSKTTKTKTSVKTGSLSERGEEYDDLFSEIMMANLRDFGNYDVAEVTKTQYADESRANSIQSQISDIDSRIAQLEAEGMIGGPGTPAGAPTMFARPARGVPGGAPGARAPQNELERLRSQKNRLESDLAGMDKRTFTDFDLKKREDIRILNAIDRFGEGSPEVQQMREDVKMEEVDRADALADVERSFLTNLQKMSEGDYSFTPEQESQINEFIDPIRGVIERTSQDLLTQFGESDEMLRDALGDVSAQIDATGFEVEDALQAAELQYEQSGENLLGILRDVNTSARNKAKFEFDLLSEQADVTAAQQGALLGLPPGSMTERVAAQKMKTDALKGIELDLAYREATGSLNIQQQTEAGKQKISLSRVALAESQGGKREAVAKTGFGLTQALTQKTEDVLGNKGNALTQLEQQRQNMLYGAGYGNLAGQLQAAQAGMGFDLNKRAGEFNLQSSLLAPVAQQLGIEQQRQFVETTTKSKTKQNKGILGTVTDVLGAGLSTAGAVMGLPGLGGGGGGGGGGMPTTYTPPPVPQIDLSVYRPTAQPQFSLEY